MFKKVGVFLISMLMCAACGSSAATTPNSNIESSENPFGDTSLSQETTAPEETEPPVAEGAETYYSTSGNFTDPYIPCITFFENGTFVMSENLLAGMGTYEGTYTYDGTYYECKVSNIDFSGFSGDDVKTIEFMRFDANLITLLTDLCGSRGKDIFSKNKPEITQENSVAPEESSEIYINENGLFEDPYKPTLELNNDGTFVLTENLYEGMGHYTGHYTKQDINLTLYVEEKDFNGFAGDNISTIEFEIMSKDVIQLMTTLCGSSERDYWYLK